MWDKNPRKPAFTLISLVRLPVSSSPMAPIYSFWTFRPDIFIADSFYPHFGLKQKGKIDAVGFFQVDVNYHIYDILRYSK